MIILRTLQGIYRLPQVISVTADLRTQASWILSFGGDYSFANTYKHHPQHCILFALAMSRLKLHSLRLDQDPLRYHNDLRAISGAGLLAITGSLKTLDIGSHVTHDEMPSYVDFFQGALQLRHLGFNTESDESPPSETICLMPLPSEVLLANRLSFLTSFIITRVIIDGRSLIEVFRRCQSTLTLLVLRHVAYTTDEDLMPVYRAMLAVPNLEFLEVQLIRAGVRPYEKFDTPHGGMCLESHKCDGIEPIKEWLRGLLERRLYLCQKEPNEEE